MLIAHTHDRCQMIFRFRSVKLNETKTLIDAVLSMCNFVLLFEKTKTIKIDWRAKVNANGQWMFWNMERMLFFMNKILNFYENSIYNPYLILTNIVTWLAEECWALHRSEVFSSHIRNSSGIGRRQISLLSKHQWQNAVIPMIFMLLLSPLSTNCWKIKWNRVWQNRPKQRYTINCVS